jgi:hypothetical protein
MPFFLNHKVTEACEALFGGKDSPRVISGAFCAKSASIFYPELTSRRDSLVLLGTF